jgi:hypothetical protein
MWPPREALPADIPGWMAAALDGLVAGDWREAYEVVRRVTLAGGNPAVRETVAIRLLARAMQLRAYGDVDGSWTTLLSVAGVFPAAKRDRGADHDHIFVVPAPDEQNAWSWLMRIAYRQEHEARIQRQRLMDVWNQEVMEARRDPGSSSRRAALVAACIEHLSWVERDPWTWGPRIEEERQADAELRRKGLPTSQSFGCEIGREYFLRRATILYHSIAPRDVGVSRRPWDALRGYRGLREQALRVLADRGEENGDCGIPCRIGHLEAIREGKLLVTMSERGMMENTWARYGQFQRTQLKS